LKDLKITEFKMINPIYQELFDSSVSILSFRLISEKKDKSFAVCRSQDSLLKTFSKTKLRFKRNLGDNATFRVTANTPAYP
jgi:hypothetical protein